MTSFSAGCVGNVHANDDIFLLQEEIRELEDQIFRLKNSMNRADNGVKLKKLAVITRLLDRCNRSLSRLKEKGVGA